MCSDPTWTRKAYYGTIHAGGNQGNQGNLPSHVWRLPKLPTFSPACGSKHGLVACPMVPMGYKSLRLQNKKRTMENGTKLWKLQHQGGLGDFRVYSGRATLGIQLNESPSCGIKGLAVADKLHTCPRGIPHRLAEPSQQDSCVDSSKRRAALSGMHSRALTKPGCLTTTQCP